MRLSSVNFNNNIKNINLNANQSFLGARLTNNEGDSVSFSGKKKENLVQRLAKKIFGSAKNQEPKPLETNKNEKLKEEHNWSDEQLSNYEFLLSLDFPSFHAEYLVDIGITKEECNKIAEIIGLGVELNSATRLVREHYTDEQIKLYVANSKRDEFKDAEKETLFYSVNENWGEKEISLFQRLISLNLPDYSAKLIVSEKFSDDEFDKFCSLISQGTDKYDAQILARSLWNGEDLSVYNSAIEKFSKGNEYEKKLADLLKPENMDVKTRKEVLSCKLTQEEFVSSLSKLAKSTYKLAFKRPNLYLSDIDVIYTTKQEDGKYPVLPKEELLKQQNDINEFFAHNIGKLARAAKYIDNDTLNQLMDKRTKLFADMLNMMSGLSDENYQLLSDLIKCSSKDRDGKQLSANEKLELVDIAILFNANNLDTSILKNMVKLKFVSLKEIKKQIQKEVFKKAGISKEELESLPSNQTKFNEEYFYTALNPRYVPQHSKTGRDVESLYEVIRQTARGTFDDFIEDPNNIYGFANKKTQEEFESFGLNYNSWFKPTIKEKEIVISDKKLTIQPWKRDPKEDLFLGNKTNCCTKIGYSENGSAMPSYLLSSAFNYIEVKDENDKTICMNRIFMTEIDGKPSIIIDNAELSQTTLKGLSKEDKTNLRNEIFEYIKAFGRDVSQGEDLDVYFSDVDVKLPNSDLQHIQTKVKLIGDVAQSDLYFNCEAHSWVDIESMKHGVFLNLYKIDK